MHSVSLAEMGEISEAPPREMLKSFGGSLTIGEYRKLVRQNKNFTIYCPPVRTIQFVCEERTTLNRAIQEAENESAARAGSFLV